MRKAYIVALVMAVLAVGGSWIYAQPGKAYMAVQAAMDKDDPALLTPYVDFAALRSNIKNREAAKLSSTLSPDAPGLVGLLASALKDLVVGSVVEGLGTPEGVLAMLRGAAASQGLGPDDAAPATPSQRLFTKAHTNLLDLHRYIIRAPLRGGATLQLLFTRDGTVWKLTDITVVTESGGSV